MLALCQMPDQKYNLIIVSYISDPVLVSAILCILSICKMEDTQNSQSTLFQHYLHGLCTAFCRGAFATGKYCEYPAGSRAKYGVHQKEMILWDAQVLEYITEILGKEPNARLPPAGYVNGITISGSYKTSEDNNLLVGWLRGLVDGYISMSEEDGPLVFDTSNADSSQRMYVSNVLQSFAKSTQVKLDADKWNNLVIRGDDKFNSIWILYHISNMFTFTTFPPAAAAVARLFNPFSSSLATHPWVMFDIGSTNNKPMLAPPSGMGPRLTPSSLRVVDEEKRIWSYETCPISTKDGYYTEIVVLDDTLGKAGWMPIRSPVLFDLTEKKVPTLTVVPFASWATDVPPAETSLSFMFVFHPKVHLTVGTRETPKDEPKKEVSVPNNNGTMTELD